MIHRHSVRALQVVLGCEKLAAFPSSQIKRSALGARANDMPKKIEPVYRLLGARIQHIRTTLGWTHAELAAKIGLVRTSVTNIEAGRQRILLHDLEIIAKAFGITAKQLLRGIWT